MRRCAVKVRVPPGELSSGLAAFLSFLRARLGEDGFDLVPAVWGTFPEAIAVMFDDAQAAGEIADWVDRQCRQAREDAASSALMQPDLYRNCQLALAC